MKKQDRTSLIKRGRRKQCFVFKKFNKQLISIVGSTMLLLGNYALIPIQVIATETTATENAPPTSTEEELSTIATVDPASPVNSTETSQEEVEPAPTEEQPAPQDQTDPQQNEVENTEEVSPTPNEEQEKEADQPPQSSPTPQLDDWEASEENGYMVISKYTGDWMNITVPSEIEGKPVQIDLKTVLDSTLRETTRTFAIEESKGLGPVKLTGSFSELFLLNSNLQSADFADADTSGITNMSYMFGGCNQLTSLNISSWDTSSVTDMSDMFSNCREMTSMDLSSWNTSSVTSMLGMFSYCTQLTSMDLSSWNTSSVTSMLGMFLDCSNLSEITCSKTFKMNNYVDLRSLPTKENEGKTTYYWRVDGKKDKKYETTNDLIDGHSNLSDTDVHTYTIEKQHNVTFDTDGGSDQPAATAIWDGEKLADPEYKGTKRDHTFVGWKANSQSYDFDQNVNEPLELKAEWQQNEWLTDPDDAGDYTTITGYTGDGENITVPSMLYNKPVQIDLSSVLGTYLGGTGAKTKTFAIQEAKSNARPVKLTGSFSQLFFSNTGLQSADFADSDISGIANMSGMFFACSALTSLDLSTWDTSSATNMSYMFSGCSQLTSLELSSWDTRRVTSMSDMFSNCNQLTSMDLSSWKIGSVTSMNSMFYYCRNLSEITCSKTFKMDNSQLLRSLPAKENDDKTTYYWRVDGEKDKKYETTDALIDSHNNLSDTDVHTYTIEKQHNVTFDTDGGSDQPAATAIWDGEKLADPEYKGTKTNYQFVDWFMDDQVFNFKKTQITEPIALTAKWRLNRYSIQFNENGGTGKMKDQLLDYEEEKSLSENAFTRTGYTFDTWNTKVDGQGTTYTDKQTVKNLSSEDGATITLYAQWKANNYQVQFDSNGGEGMMASQPMTYDQTTNLIENTFTRKGYAFSGWNTQEDGKGTTYTDKVAVKNLTTEKDGQVKLYAQWKIETYIIDFDSNGGETVPSKNYTVETESFSLPKAERKGYTFQGWYDGDKTIETIEKGSTGDKELTAKWKAIEYTVSFDSAGGSEVTDQTYTIEQGIDSFKAPTRKGYTFQGWYDEEGKEVERIEDGETGNRTLVAKWTIITYTITFDDLTMDPITYTVESDTIPLPKKERVGHTFLGWLVEEDTIARVLSDQPMIVQEIKSGTTGNLKLSAQWKANQYTISFDPNGGIGELPSQTLNYDESVKLSANKFTRTGYAFTGWNTQADGKGTTFTDQQEVKNLLAEANGNLTLFAQWKTTKTALDELVNKEAEAKRNKNDYTQESWKKYEDALKQAQGVLADLNATEDEVKTALTELQAAIANLKPFKNSDQIAQTSTRKTYPTSAAKSYPGTGMLASSGLMILGIAAVGTAIAGWKKRKGK